MVCSYRQICLRKRYLVLRLSNCFLYGVLRKKKSKKTKTHQDPTHQSFSISHQCKEKNNFPLLLGTVLAQSPFAGSLFDNDIRQIINKKQLHSRCETRLYI